MSRKFGGGKPIIVLGVAGVLALASACGSSSSTAGGGGSTKKPKIALVLPFTGIAFMQHQIDGATVAAADSGVDLKVVTGQGPDGAAQVKLMNDAVTAGAQGLVVMPIAPTLFTRPLNDIAAKKIPVATITIHAEDGVKQAYVGSSEYNFVEPSIKYLSEKLGPDAKGKVVLGTCSVGTGILEDRTNAQKKYMGQYLPGMTVTGPVVTAQDAGKNFAAWQAAINANADAKLFMGNCPFDGASLVKAKASNAGAPWQAASLGVGPEMLTGIKGGSLLFGVDEVEWARAYVAVSLVAKALKDGTALPDGWINTGQDLVTRDNVADATARYDATGQAAKPFFKTFIGQGLAARPQPLSALTP